MKSSSNTISITNCLYLCDNKRQIYYQFAVKGGSLVDYLLSISGSSRDWDWEVFSLLWTVIRLNLTTGTLRLSLSLTFTFTLFPSLSRTLSLTHSLLLNQFLFHIFSLPENMHLVSLWKNCFLFSFRRNFLANYY